MPGLSEKYRPKTLDEVIGQERAKEVIRRWIKAVKEEGKQLPHFLFYGPAGTGKTTMAYVLANELGMPIIELNASDERGIDVVREKIKRLALSKGRRILLLDEADALTEDAQQALRRIMEKAEEYGTVSFILTANFPWKIIDPIKSRCVNVPFSRLPEDQVKKRLVEILKKEGIKVRTKQELMELKEALGIIIRVSNGDMRKALKYLESLIATSDKITVELVKGFISEDVVERAMDRALRGDLEGAIRDLEDALVSSLLTPEDILYKFYSKALSLSNPVTRAKVLIELRRVEEALRLGGSPLIQLSGFLATVWLYNHISGKR